jgi:hypothetical protein
MSLAVFFCIEEDNDGSHKIHDFTGGQQVEVGSGIPTSITINPF